MTCSGTSEFRQSLENLLHGACVVFQDALPGSDLCRPKFQVDTICGMCGLEVETAMHWVFSNELLAILGRQAGLWTLIKDKHGKQLVDIFFGAWRNGMYLSRNL
ncbi:hypothetical protein PanWU01x14_157230 [Parasponia andersonii]|uniref:Uncharacterized protein n=1 Tax=Parasponia andersonii TaxID=3476 RepID=A0A2P5CFN1_PARAD|nr:hypothetical protein PanWU01x14_157230 [Parasponia andersonii]